MSYKVLPSALKRMRDCRGSQLVEFAFTMPLLIVIAIGITDFGQAYNTKQILTNAAREAARVTVSQPLSNSACTGTTPCSIQAAAEAVRSYLMNAGLNTASCIAPGTPSGSGTLTWTYACNGVSLTVNRGFAYTATGGMVVPSTQVTLAYPYTWTFNNVIGLLVSGQTASLPASITTTFIMQNLV
jgi:Flp pilus assembly protein TadG